uniref:Glyceraldehyde-3-phosphate dehydrogenase n=4 Tax=Eukaryota TaxID=2759 RepID=Q7XYJ5_BIGNA|nr:glyceraldehyde-3-phosphate dehydrogenase [Bigelowiella natans]|mmetsp:Transcript_41189/g.66943  ORF Transcript_41189/g.66943 Transcript_41189/m.66943 type:complete len:464 (+) Transcript_41189:374-1765(+)|eukprot:jgi/Bigna1/50264/estExt_Genewise1.C_720053
MYAQHKKTNYALVGSIAVNMALVGAICFSLSGASNVAAPAMRTAPRVASMSRTMPMSMAGQRVSVRPKMIQRREMKAEALSYTVDDIRGMLGDDVANQILAKNTPTGPERNVVLYGFGRIGRLLARIITTIPTNLKLKGIVVRQPKKPDLEKRLELIKRDSVHGPFRGTISMDEADNALIMNGQKVRLIYANQPEEVDYTKYGINDAIVIDNTGVWRDDEGLAKHLSSKGAAQVILTAPGKGVKNIVAGVNSDVIEGSDKILSAASCTTNAVVPALSVLHKKFGIVSGHIETVHSFTNDQNLIDNYHKADRRGRAGPLNMVISETGAGKAVAVALPELAGKLTASAIRVPTPDVSIAVMILDLEKSTTAEEINAAFKSEATGTLDDNLGYSDSKEAVSLDFIGSTHAGEVDALATKCTGNSCIVYVWYDNENGYSNQVVRVVEQWAAKQEAAGLKFEAAEAMA